MRINKYLKDKGFTTRRGADELIKKGAVLVNGKKATLGMEVYSDDDISISGTKSGVREEKIYYIAYNKPIGILTNKDEASGKDILTVTNFKDESGKEIRVFPVGRLDKDSHGLIILTNDGRVTDKLLSPRFLHEKEYHVVTDRPFNDFFLSAMAQGVRIDGSVTRKAKVERLKPNSFSIILTEGKKRQIRRMCEALHQNVVDLQRIRIMNITLEKLKPGEYRHLTKEERKTFLKSLYIAEKETMTMATPSPKKVVKAEVQKKKIVEEKLAPKKVVGKNTAHRKSQSKRAPKKGSKRSGNR